MSEIVRKWAMHSGQKKNKQNPNSALNFTAADKVINQPLKILTQGEVGREVSEGVYWNTARDTAVTTPHMTSRWRRWCSDEPLHKLDLLSILFF